MNIINNPQYWVATWGYEQTNIDFYLVIKKTKNTVWLQKAVIAHRKPAGAWAQEYIAPLPCPEANAPILRRKVQRYSYNGKEEQFCRIASYSQASPWNGEPVLETSYA